MSFTTKSVAIAFSGLLLFSSVALAQVGGGTELPSSAEPQSTKDSTEKSMDKGSMQKGGSMKKSDTMKNGAMMKKSNSDKM